MWEARTKIDLIIEVWEKLDCESVGATEIAAIETVVANQYGESAVDSPMVMARLLADEGAELRHSEIMKLYVERASERPYDAALRNIVRIDGLKSTLVSIRDLENLRLKYTRAKDKEGLRLVREAALTGKRLAGEKAENRTLDTLTQHINAEIFHWLTLWLQTPEVFETWVTLRKRSPEFIEKFGEL